MATSLYTSSHDMDPYHHANPHPPSGPDVFNHTDYDPRELFVRIFKRLYGLEYLADPQLASSHSSLCSLTGVQMIQPHCTASASSSRELMTTCSS